ncbi:MAG: hypothetical protein Q4D29_01315 [Lachnospiraceae bacterium]|nr:hypothetical protein [Lachnospiraceae bacterium]
MAQMTQSLKGEPTLKGYRYKVVVDQFPITDKVVDVLGVQSSHVESRSKVRCDGK